MMPPKRPLSVDGFDRRRAAQQARAASALQSVPAPGAGPQPLAGVAPSAPRTIHRTFTPPSGRAERRRWWQNLAVPGCMLAGLIAGFFMQSLLFGLGVTIVYGLVAWVCRIPSRITFVLAFLSLLTVVVLLTVRQNAELSSNFATYTFLLLVVGIVSLVLESRPKTKARRAKMRRKI